jgi:hypothetical protein
MHPGVREMVKAAAQSEDRLFVPGGKRPVRVEEFYSDGRLQKVLHVGLDEVRH